MSKTPELASKSKKQLPAQMKDWEGSSAYVEQGRHWSSALIWLCSVLFGGTLLWAFTARIDQTVTVRGRLEPSGSVRDVESPSAGVVSKVFVKDGQQVQPGQPLFDVEAKGLASRRQALETTLSLFELQSNPQRHFVQWWRSGSISAITTYPAVDDPNGQQLRTPSAESAISVAGSSCDAVSIGGKACGFGNLTVPETLYEQGGMARNQFFSQRNRVQEVKAEVSTLEKRLKVIGQLAAQLNQIDRQMIQIKAELVGARTISYRTIRAPISGKFCKGFSSDGYQRRPKRFEVSPCQSLASQGRNQ